MVVIKGKELALKGYQQHVLIIDIVQDNDDSNKDDSGESLIFSMAHRN